ncbi:GntR family transcriptional regulator [Saccharopolyspora sp. K220]|uniref:GntR family transcriptional regulator n=1 Tax=Saccharopolyspora soli TaxID=2926618 RepID=UPI001F55B020|nr:GntR family transcriptional regulator [Saccharopolyspora soli]MCI2422614.1 GntR family transcriptional regulator [Saccharopolyspora soli]
MTLGRIDEHEYMARVRERARSAGTVRQRSSLRLHGLIRSAIRLGLLPSRHQLSEGQLIDAYATSRNAVREAMSLLAEEGLVSRRPRRGTVIVGMIRELALEDMSPRRGSLADFDNPDDFENIEVETTRIPITPLLQNRLRTNVSSVWLTEWITLRGGEPFCIYINYSLGDSARELGTDSSSDGLQAIFRRTYGCELRRIDTTVETLTCDERTGRALRVEPGSPLLFRERLMIDADGNPRECNHTFFPGAKVSLRTTTVFPSEPLPADKA